MQFIAALDLKDVTLVGECIGATTALTVSTEIPDRIRQVIALNTYDYPGGVERANLIASFVIKAMKIPVVGLMFSKLANPPILGGIMGGGFHDPKKLPKDFVLEQLRSGKRPGYATAEQKYLYALPSFIEARDLYARIAVPVTLVYGNDDWSSPADRAEVARAVPGARLIALADTGHFSSLERADEVARIVSDVAG